MLTRRILPAAWIVSALAVAGSAQAHFYLQHPPSWKSQGPFGDPQKAGPCGEEAGGTPSGVVTPFQPGETITITLEERIPHPGHYRVALAVNNRSELPADPVVTPGDTPCGSTVIQNPPVFPVLADGALKHSTVLSGMQMIKVKLPDNVKCTKCTLQIIEFMSDHDLNNPGGCYYHHCADISIGASTGTGGAGGTGATGSGGTGGSAGSSAGTGGAGAGAGGSGGAGGSAGVSGSGSGGASGGVGGSAGTSGGVGASAGAGGSGTGATNAADPAMDESGCSCSVPGRPQQLAGFAAMLVTLLGFAWRRRGSSR